MGFHGISWEDHGGFNWRVLSFCGSFSLFSHGYLSNYQKLTCSGPAQKLKHVDDLSKFEAKELDDLKSLNQAPG